METMNAEGMKSLQEERFLSIVRWAYKRTSFYREKFQSACISPSDIRSMDDIRKIPFIYKDDLRISQEKNPPYGGHCASAEQICQTYWSTGTTGKPTLMGVSKKEARYWTDVIARNLFACGLRNGDRFHHASQLSSFAGGFGFLLGAQLIGANVIPAGAGNTRQHVWLISKLKPRFLKILPSYANYVAETGNKMGIDMRACGVKRIFLSAEPAPPALRRDIEQKWGAITYDNYGLSDVGQPQAFECDEHNGLHAFQDWCLTEVVDLETKLPITEKGREGVLVYTNLIRRAMPAIRFWTNNISAWKSFKPCACGRTYPRIEPVQSRIDDMMKIKGVNFWPSAVWAVVGGHKELAGTHRIIVESRGGRDYLKVILELKEDTGTINIPGLCETLKSKFQSALFIQVDEIEIVPFGTLEISAHKDKTIVDRRTV
jgi:phenylacetate-CoA ligase